MDIGGKHFSSLQTIYSIVPDNCVLEATFNVTDCTNRSEERR